MAALPILIGHRNLWRNKRRTLITALSVGLGVWVAVIFIGVRRATYERLIATGTKMGYGELTLTAPDFLSSPSPELHIPVQAATALIAGLGDTGEGSGKNSQGLHSRGLDQGRGERGPPGLGLIAVPRLAIFGIVATATRSAGVALLAGDPLLEKASLNLFLQALKQGTALTAGDANGCLVGTQLAKQLALELGAKIVYSLASPSGEVVSHLAYVRGIFQTGSAELDGHMLLLPLASLQQLLGYSPDQASLLALYRSPVTPPLPEVQAQLTRAVAASPLAGQLQLHNWRQTLPDLAQSIDIDQAMYRLVFCFIAIIVGSSIINTMMLNILERRRELGIMLAMGMPPLTIVAMMIWEAMSIGLLGVILGLVTVTPIYLYLHYVGLDLSWLIGEKFDAGGVAIDFVLGCGLSALDVAVLGGALFLMTMIASLYPAYRAASTVPINAIREI